MGKRVLIVNCYFDETRRPVARTYKIPQAMGPVFLAGAFSDACEVRLYNEQFKGPLTDRGLLGWPDMLVLTGLATSLDRMLHLTAYARTLNPTVVVVAGGYAVQALPRFGARYFDYCCRGGVEELREVAREALGAGCVSSTMTPRYDLADWIGRIGYVESSRYCNFSCSFCALTVDGRGHQNYSLDALQRQIEGLGRRDYLSFIDNNFYGADRRHFAAKLDLLGDLHRERRFKGWMALVTSDFFADERNLERARRAGCKTLFSGVESFDGEWLDSANKRHNTRTSPLELIRRTMEAGIVFLYGLVFDPTRRTVADMRREIDYILGHPEIPLPAYISLSVPLLGTPFFKECVKSGSLLPNTRVRDLDGSTLSVRPLDSIEEIQRFARGDQHFASYRMRALVHTAGFLRRYRSVLDVDQIALATANAAVMCAPLAVTAPAAAIARGRRRTYVSSTDLLDDVYRPAMPVDREFAGHFAPTLVTDELGELSSAVAGDLSDPVWERRGVGDYEEQRAAS